MAIGDPFQTVYEGTRQGLGSFGQALQQTAQQFAVKKEKAVEQDRTVNMMKQFGLLKEDQPTLEDYQKEFEKQTKTKITGVKGNALNDPNTLEGIKSIFDYMGLSHPKSKGMIFDTDTAQRMGATIKLSDTLALTPKKPDKTFGETLAEAQIASEKGLEYKGGKAQTKGAGGYGTAQIAFAEKMAPGIAEQMKRGEVAGYLKSTKATQTAVANILSEEGVNVDDLVLGYGGEQAAMGNAKIQDQKVNAAISAKTLLDSSFDPETGEWRVPPSMHVELALSVARLLSATGQIPYEMVEELRQKTAREQFATMAIFFGADPREVGGSTQDVIKLFSKTIEREAKASEAMRDKYFTGKFSKFEDTGKQITDATGLTTPKQEVPKGYKKQVNKRTGETRIVPIGE